MNRTEDNTCREVIEPALERVGCSWDRHLHLGPGRVNISGASMYDETQRFVADDVLRLSPVVRKLDSIHAAVEEMQKLKCGAETFLLRKSILREAFAGNL